MLSQESGERRYIATVYQTSPLILVFLHDAGLWRWLVGWGQVRRLSLSHIAKIGYCCRDWLVLPCATHEHSFSQTTGFVAAAAGPGKPRTAAVEVGARPLGVGARVAAVEVGPRRHLLRFGP